MHSFHSVICCRSELLHHTNVYMPNDEINNKIKVRLAEEIGNSLITLGELIVPKAFTKLTMEKNKLKTEDFQVHWIKFKNFDTLLLKKKVLKTY